MDQTGFPADTIILSLSAADWRHRQELEQSNVFEKYTKGLKKTLLVLKDLQKSDDIDLLVKVEASLISMERSLYAKNDPSVLPSLNAAVRDFEDIKKAVDVVKSVEVDAENRQADGAERHQADFHLAAGEFFAQQRTDADAK